jgi:hypothetical protein
MEAAQYLVTRFFRVFGGEMLAYLPDVPPRPPANEDVDLWGASAKDHQRTGPGLEDRIVEDIVSGRLRFRGYVVDGWSSSDTHYDCLNADIKARVDHANIGGTFSFLYVGGVDYSFGRDGVDYLRVVRAIASGADPRKTETSVHGLYHA